MSQTCCLVVPIRAGAVTISVIGVLASAAFGVVFAKEIEDGMMSTPDDHPAAKLVPYVSMCSWVALAIISLFGCVAAWSVKPRLVSVYFWTLLTQYFIDLGFLVVTIFFCITTAQTSKSKCEQRATQQGFSNVDDLCSAALSASNILLLAILCAYKLFATYAVFVIFQFKRWTSREALEREAQRTMLQRPPQQFTRHDYDANTVRNWSKFDD
ncbi:hypothetical protein FS842_003985 [Serendipita sp. 407]|nr:hypothetical protein FS842_003985 [Serendipita sp. 407]